MRPIDQRRRADLVEAALAHLGRAGLAGFSLRGLAAELGTSARMLVHYFGGKEELMRLAFAEHRRRTLAAVTAVGSADPAAAAALSWRNLAAPDERRHYALMFQLMAASLTGDHPYREVATDAVLAWVDAAAGLIEARGVDRDAARARATALVSGLKGIALDLQVTGDRPRCDAAATVLIAAILQFSGANAGNAG